MLTPLHSIAATLLVAASILPSASAQSPEGEIASVVDRFKEAMDRQEATEGKAAGPAKAAFIKELDRLLVQSQSKSDLDAMAEAQAALKAVQDGGSPPRGKVLAAAFSQAEGNYERSRELALRIYAPARQKLEADYDRTIAALMQKFIRAGNIEAAKKAREARRALLTVDAWVDGPSTLVIRKDGCYWVNGGNGKPYQTFIDGRSWAMRWTKPDKPRGEDKSDARPLQLPTIDLSSELVSVSSARGGTGIDQRTPLEFKPHGNELHIVIPDPEPGARWYKLRFRIR